MSDQPIKETSIPITADDIREFDFEEFLSRPRYPILEKFKDRTCFNYERHFVDEAKAAAVLGNTSRQAICELFAAVCSFQLTLDGSEPYSSKWIFDGKRSLIPSDLPSPYRKLLLEVVQDIQDSELQARVADVLWVIREGKYQIAALAVNA